MGKIGYPARRSLRFGDLALSALEAMALIALRESELGRAQVPYLLWRRMLASNLSDVEWRRKGFRRAKSKSWYGKALAGLHDLALVSESHPGAGDSYLTGSGVAAAEKLRPLFSAALSVGDFQKLVEKTYSRVSGRFAM